MDMGKLFIPEKYGLLLCPECKGKGKSPKSPDGYNVYLRCGGSGVVKKEKIVPEKERK